MALVNSVLDLPLNGELANETNLNSPTNQLLANDVAIDERLVSTESRILALRNLMVDDLAFFNSLAY
jgi:hypothetical protein